MRESRWITLLRLTLLLTFVAIALYPALNVLSISLRPGNRLRSTISVEARDVGLFECGLPRTLERRSSAWASIWLAACRPPPV